MPCTREVLIRAIEWFELAQLGSALMITACVLLNSKGFFFFCPQTGGVAANELGECKLSLQSWGKCNTHWGWSRAGEKSTSCGAEPEGFPAAC